MKTIHDKRVEAAAKAIYDAATALVPDAWDHESDDEKAWWLNHAREVLLAADAVVSEEQVKWQYGLQDSDGFVGFRNLSLKSLRKRAKLSGEVIVRRRPATKWEEVSNDTE